MKSFFKKLPLLGRSSFFECKTKHLPIWEVYSSRERIKSCDHDKGLVKWLVGGYCMEKCGEIKRKLLECLTYVVYIL